MAETRLFVHIAEAARDLGLSELKVRQLIASGRLPVEPIGKRTYIPAAAVKAYKQRIQQMVEDAL
jgi:excisionase family DNA binding protein